MLSDRTRGGGYVNPQFIISIKLSIKLERERGCENVARDESGDAFTSRLLSLGSSGPLM